MPTRTVEYTEKPEWDIDIREQIYQHLRACWRLNHQGKADDALHELNEAIALLYVCRCASDAPGSLHAGYRGVSDGH